MRLEGRAMLLPTDMAISPPERAVNTLRSKIIGQKIMKLRLAWFLFCILANFFSSSVKLQKNQLKKVWHFPKSSKRHNFIAKGQLQSGYWPWLLLLLKWKKRVCRDLKWDSFILSPSTVYCLYFVRHVYSLGFLNSSQLHIFCENPFNITFASAFLDFPLKMFISRPYIGQYLSNL